MSRIGSMPIPIPNGVEVQIEDSTITVGGPKGSLTKNIHPDMIVKVEDGSIVVQRPSDNKMHRSLHGLTRALIANMVEGVTKGFQKVLQVYGTGYRAELAGKKLTLQVGYSHPVELTPRPGVEFEVGQDVVQYEGRETRIPLITVRGIDKQAVGQQAAEVRAVRKPEPYKGRGIRYSTEVVRRKAGKSGKAAVR
ncbi:MAG TPA: 50S ribosomal protein L6 [Armatimonadota bacterium]|nr:50S ribosomal protein L6 [Armatimonadota bacterium]